MEIREFPNISFEPLGRLRELNFPIHVSGVSQIFFLKGLDGFDVRKIDDIEYTVEISCYFLTKWKDDRLILHDDIIQVSESAAEKAAINGTIPEETWFPIDLEFVSKVGQIYSHPFRPNQTLNLE